MTARSTPVICVLSIVAVALAADDPKSVAAVKKALARQAAPRNPRGPGARSAAADGPTATGAAGGRAGFSKRKDLQGQREQGWPITDVAFSADGKTLAAANHFKVRLWQVGSGKQLAAFLGKSGEQVMAVRFLAGGKQLVSVSNRTVRVWDWAKGAEIKSLPGRHSVELSRDGKRLLAATEDGCGLWRTDNWKFVRAFRLPAHRVLALSPDGRMVAAGEVMLPKIYPRNYKAAVIVLSAETGKELARVPSFANRVVFSPEGKRLAVVKGGVALWSLAGKKLLRTFKAGRLGCGSAAFSPDGRLIAAGGGYDPATDKSRGAVAVWDVATGRLLATLAVREGKKGDRWVTNVAFSPDGRYLAACDYRGAVRIWQVPAARDKAAKKPGPAASAMARSSAAPEKVRPSARPRAGDPFQRPLDKDDIGRMRADRLVRPLREKRDVGALLELLGHEDRYVRESAARGLGRLGDKRAIEALVTALMDGQYRVSRAAANALKDIDRKWAATAAARKAVPALIASVRASNFNGPLHVVKALGAIGDARAVEPLVGALSCRGAAVRETAARALAQIDPKWRALPTARKAVPQYAAALKDKARGKRLPAALALGFIADARAVEPLIAALKDGDSSLRREAARALGNIGDARAMEPLIAVLADREYKARYAAAGALGRIGDARAVPALVAALKDRSDFVRMHAAEALGLIGDRRATEPVIGALTDRAARVRGEAARALAKLGDARGAEPLVAAVKKDGSAISEALADLLAKAAQRRHVGPIIATMGQWHPGCRRHVTPALRRLTGRDFGVNSDLWSDWWQWWREEGSRGRRPALGSWKLVKTVRIAIREDYGKAKDVRLPVRPWAEKVLGVWGLKCAAPDQKADAALQLTVRGKTGWIKHHHGPLLPGGREPTPWEEVVPTEVSVTGIFAAGGEPGMFGLSVEASPREIPARAASGPVLLKAFHQLPLAPFLLELHRLRGQAAPLIAALRHKDAAMRQGAAEALGELGPAAKGAGAALRQASRDANPGVREAAAKAMKKIGTSPATGHKQFLWGKGKIEIGMTKPQVLKQIELSWQRPGDDPFAGMSIPGIDRIRKPKAEGNEWLLSFGPHTGHAPGGGHIRLFFVNGKLKRIEMIPTVAG